MGTGFGVDWGTGFGHTVLKCCIKDSNGNVIPFDGIKTVEDVSMSDCEPNVYGDALALCSEVSFSVKMKMTKKQKMKADRVFGVCRHRRHVRRMIRQKEKQRREVLKHGVKTQRAHALYVGIGHVDKASE